MSTMLTFQTQYIADALELADCLSNFENVEKFVDFAKIKWLYTTNLVDGVATEMFSNTVHICVTGNTRAPGQAAVFAMLSLLAADIVPPIDVEQVLSWHARLLGHEHPSVLTEPDACLSAICAEATELLQNISEKNFANKLLDVFGVAAHVLYRFEKEKPFAVANGRVGRLLAKVILDTALPLTFPMFTKPDFYTNALEQGPSELLQLMFDEARSFYKDLLAKQFDPDFYIYVANMEELEEQLGETYAFFSKAQAEEVKKTFQELDVNESRVICDGTVQVTRAIDVAEKFPNLFVE